MNAIYIIILGWQHRYKVLSQFKISPKFISKIQVET